MEEYTFTSSRPRRMSAHEHARTLRNHRTGSKRRKFAIKVFAFIIFAVIAVALSPYQIMQDEPIIVGINSENWMPIVICLFGLVIAILMERSEDDFMHSITKILSSQQDERQTR